MRTFKNCLNQFNKLMGATEFILLYTLFLSPSDVSV